MPGDEIRTQAPLVAGRYQLLRELGRGGMGVVWLADDHQLDRRVAVKELRPPPGLSAAEREVSTQRALREARNAARIQHPNAVTLYDSLPATAADDAIYLIMELIDGPTLAQLIRRNGQLPDTTVASLGIQLLDVLQAAHDLGIVHRDIKPANVMVATGNQVKLTDFGIAHTVGDPRLTDSGTMGTQAYMAPELFSDQPITPAADLWSLGATLYHAAQGQGPFNRESAETILRAILIDDIPVPHCSPGLSHAISAMLRRDPQRRATIPQSRTQLLAATTPATDPAVEPSPSSGPSLHPPPITEGPEDEPSASVPEPPSGIVPPPLRGDATIFTNMPSRLSLALLRASWVVTLIGSAVGWFFVAQFGGLGIGIVTFALWFILMFFGTLIFLGIMGRWRILVLDPRGLSVSIAALKGNRNTIAEARWDQVARIGCFHRDGKPRLFLSAWISDGKAKPARMVRLCPVGPPHFPMDEIRTAILSYCPTVSIEMPQDR